MQQHNLYARYKISLRKKLFDLSEVAVNIRQIPYKYPTSLRSWCVRTFENKPRRRAIISDVFFAMVSFEDRPRRGQISIEHKGNNGNDLSEVAHI